MVVTCEPTGHRWRVLDQICLVHGVALVRVQLLLVCRAREAEDFTRNKNDDVDGVFNLVSGTGPGIGEAIATHPLGDIVSLTGSVRAGSRVMGLASKSVKRVTLELDGKSANIILEDADLEKAINDGLTCRSGPKGRPALQDGPVSDEHPPTSVS